MPADASSGEIRAAYRRLVRQHHPDVAGTQADGIHELNEAYRVLGDPSRRVVYDQSLRAPAVGPEPGSTGADAPAPDAPPPPLPAPRFPWRGFAVLTTLAVVLVAAASVLTRPSDPPGPDGLLQPGSCVTIEPNTDARETSCTGDAAVDIVVRALVPFGVACPFGTEPHRDHQGLGTACLVFP